MQKIGLKSLQEYSADDIKRRHFQMLLFHHILLPVVRFSCLNRDQISLRDKRLLEISEVEITSVDCICISFANRIDPNQTEDVQAYLELCWSPSRKHAI